MRWLLSPTTLRIWPLEKSFVPDIETSSERSLISSNTTDGRKLAMGPMCYPAKCVPEINKKSEAVYRQWMRVL
jgi:hypothetical protein